MHDVDAKIVQKFYEYQWVKRDEDMVRVAQAQMDYRKLMLNPARITAVMERISKTKRVNK